MFQNCLMRVLEDFADAQNWKASKTSSLKTVT